MSSNQASAPLTFEALQLSQPILKALEDIGYEAPSPIQALTIPLLLDGKDVLGQAQTGTGKTAAFAIPALSKLNFKQKKPQVMILAPTRELAIQVSEAIESFGQHIQGLKVLPIYGGGDYMTQTKALKRGVHVAVGTPGRVMDHMRRGNLDLSEIQYLVLDEADEMLRMGFIEDVEWVLEHTPDERQIALFSATMPKAIEKIAKQHLKDPEVITIKAKHATATGIEQRYCLVHGGHAQKLDALIRILEAESLDGSMIFARTKSMTVELADQLNRHGYRVAALNGDMQQKQREKTIEQLKAKKIDMVIATDVAARGIDVERISHVINYDIPFDAEAYVHRIGRTGRAGREGDAILLLSPREKGMLKTIERVTKSKITPMDIPSADAINQHRIERFKQQITDTINDKDISFFVKLIEEYQTENEVPPLHIAASLAQILQGNQAFLVKDKPQPKKDKSENRRDSDRNRRDSDRRGSRDRNASPRGFKDREAKDLEPMTMQKYRIEVGRNHGVKPRNIVGAIANEAGLDSFYIQNISIQDNFTMLDLPEGMPKDVFQVLKKSWVSGQQLNISSMKESNFRNSKKEPNFRKKKFSDKRKRKGA